MGEIVNPYIAGAPVTEQRMFFGREDIFQWVENSIAGQYADHILVVHGQRRVGKTSVLKQLGNRLPKRYIPVFFDLQGRTHTTLDHFLWWLARETVRVLKQDRDIEVPPPEKEAFATDPEFFENQFLTSVRSSLGKNTLLLTFDEFDNLEESEVKQELARPLVDHLRRLMGQPNLNFIFSIGSSGRKLENMQAAYTDFFKTALYKKISFLNEEQTHNLVTRPVAGMIEYERGAVDRIYGITSGHPYFTQLTCHELFARCQRTEQRKIAIADVESVLDDVVERGTVNLKFVWDEASDLEKWSLAALAQLDKTDNRALADYLRKNRVRFSETDLTSGLLHLREKDVLTPQNRFVIHLLRIWLQKNRPIEQAREELTEANPIASRFIEIGLEFRDGGQYEKAIEFFRQALSVSADNLQAQVNIALTYAAQGQLEQAIAEFEKALTMDDEDVASRAGLCDAHLKLGNMAISKGRIQDAIQSYQRVLKINTEHTEARQRMAEINLQRAKKSLADGRDEEALNAFLEALKYTPEDPALIEQLEKFKAEKKEKVLASLVARSEREAKALNWEGVVKTLEEANHLSPEDSNIQNKLADARGKLREKTLVGLKVKAQGLADAEKFDDALKTWQEYLSLKPDDHQKVEEAIARIKKEQELLDTYNNAGQAITDRNFDQAINLLKEVIFRDENYKDASRLLTRAIELRRTASGQKQIKTSKKPERLQQPRSRSGIKPGGRRIWVIGGLLAILILGIGGGLFWVWQNELPAMPGLFAKNTATPTITATITPTRIPTLTPTATPIPAWIEDFAEPILAAIQVHEPDFQDDFSTNSGQWNQCEGCTISDGVLKINLPNDWISAGGPLKAINFVLQFDFTPKFLAYNSFIAVVFRNADLYGDKSYYSFGFSPSTNWWGMEKDTKGGMSASTLESGFTTQLSVGAKTKLLIIARGDQVAVYLNDKPLVHHSGILDSGDWVTITSGDRGSGLGVEGHTEVDFDNVQFWNLDNITNLP